ncbi:MAG: hypothetical protein R2698_03300 [Microthrixaceae bacterium]
MRGFGRGRKTPLEVVDEKKMVAPSDDFLRRLGELDQFIGDGDAAVAFPAGETRLGSISSTGAPTPSRGAGPDGQGTGFDSTDRHDHDSDRFDQHDHDEEAASFLARLGELDHFIAPPSTDPPAAWIVDTGQVPALRPGTPRHDGPVDTTQRDPGERDETGRDQHGHDDHDDEAASFLERLGELDDFIGKP